MLSRTLCLTVAVLLLGTVLCSRGAKFAVATFTDDSCGTLSSFPDVPTAGECSFSSEFQFFYNVSARSDTVANYNFGCNGGCQSCLKSGSVPYGSCVSAPPLSALILPVQSTSVSFTVYQDSSCSTVLVPTQSAQSGVCSTEQSLGTIFELVLSQGKIVAYGLGCNPDCTQCDNYGLASVGECINVGTVSVIVTA